MTNVLDCVSVNRYEGVDDEDELENRAVKHMADNEFLAGIRKKKLQIFNI